MSRLVRTHLRFVGVRDDVLVRDAQEACEDEAHLVLRERFPSGVVQDGRDRLRRGQSWERPLSTKLCVQRQIRTRQPDKEVRNIHHTGRVPRRPMIHPILLPALVRNDVEQHVHSGIRVARGRPVEHRHAEDDRTRADDAEHGELAIALRAAVEIERVRARGGRVRRGGSVEDVVRRDVDERRFVLLREAREVLRDAGVQLRGRVRETGVAVERGVKRCGGEGVDVPVGWPRGSARTVRARVSICICIAGRGSERATQPSLRHPACAPLHSE